MKIPKSTILISELAVLVVLLAATGFMIGRDWEFYRIQGAEQEAMAKQEAMKISNKKLKSTEKKEVRDPFKKTPQRYLYTLTLPAGWAEAGSGSCDGYGYRYTDANGNFFDVCINPQGNDEFFDHYWTLTQNGNGYRIVKEETYAQFGGHGECTKDDNVFCSLGDGRLTIHIADREDGWISRNNYYFRAGNNTREAADFQIFRNLLKGFRVIPSGEAILKMQEDLKAGRSIL